MTGLANGTPYTFMVVAVNSEGTGSVSAASNSVTPKAAQTITFANPGAKNFGTTPSLSASATSGLAITFTSSTTSVCTVSEDGVLTFLAAGSATIVASQAGNGTYLPAADVEQTFTVNAVAPGAPTIGTATPGNGQATVSFTAPTSTGGATITSYMVTSSPGGKTATGSGSPITVTGLTNGISYTFTVTATNSAGTSPASEESSSIVPFTNSTITPTIASFDKYASSTDYQDIVVTMQPNGNILSALKNGTTTLVPGTDYTVSGTARTIKKEYLKTLGTGTVNITFVFNLGDAPVLAITVADTNPVNLINSTTVLATVEVNGRRLEVGTADSTTVDGQSVSTITFNDANMEEILKSNGDKPTIILTNSGSDVVVGELSGQTIKNMENKGAVLEIKTEGVTYILPASEINIDAISAQLGSQVQLKDIKVSVRISEPSGDTTRIVEDAANKRGLQIVGRPVEFEITCKSGDKTVDVSKFNGYVERLIPIPDEIDPSEITSGVVLNADGTFSHVPTQIVLIDGKNYAKINSLTNSVYAVIYNPVEFSDVANHWAKDAINDMGSRMVVTGVGSSTYEPDRSITRAEFAAVVVRALGLQKGTMESGFGDVTLTDWFNGYVDTATAYSLITGYDSASYGPNDAITREQAMAIIARAMKLTDLSTSLTDSEVSALLANYTDGASVSSYARESVAQCLKAAVVTGASSTTLSPKSYVTRAEVAVMVQRMLQKSGLI